MDVLVIDAEPTVRNTINNILGSAGFSVRATGKLEEALELLQRSPSDLVLTDVFIDGVSALEAIVKIKEVSPDVPVLLVSGLPDPKVIREWRHKDGFDVLPKPFHSGDLVYKVREMLTACHVE